MNRFSFFIKRRRIFLLQLLILPFLLTGCWSAVEIHNIAFINAMAVDLNDEDEYEISVAISNPSAVFSQTFIGKTGGNQQNKYLFEKSTGRTIFEAIGKLSHSISEKIYFGHMDVVIFGEKVAKEKMLSSIDYFRRENQFRPNIRLLVTKGQAGAFLSNTPSLNTSIGLEIMDYTKPNRYASSKNIKDLSQFLKDYSKNYTDSVTAVLTTAENLGIKMETLGQETNKDEQKQRLSSLNGLAVFKEGKLKGFLAEKESHGFLWLKGDMQNEVITLPCGKNENEYVSAIIRENNTQYTPMIDEKHKSMTVKINLDAEISEVTCPSLQISSKEIEQLNQKLEKLVKKEVNHVLKKVQQQWQTDIFGFGEAIYREYPLEWDNLAPSWRNSGLKQLVVNVDVKANLSRYGLRKNPN